MLKQPPWAAPWDCVQAKKYGRLLYQKNGDILKALSSALGKACQMEKHVAHLQSEYSSVITCKHITPGATNNELSEDTLVEACNILNVRINRQAKRLIETYQKYPLPVQPLTLKN